MKVICRERNSGKTDELIDLCVALEAKDPKNVIYIVCPTMRRAHYVFRRAFDQGKTIRQPLSFLEIRGGHALLGSRITHVLIDDAHTCLQDLFGPVRVHAVTLTED